MTLMSIDCASCKRFVCLVESEFFTRYDLFCSLDCYNLVSIKASAVKPRPYVVDPFTGVLVPDTSKVSGDPVTDPDVVSLPFIPPFP